MGMPTMKLENKQLINIYKFKYCELRKENEISGLTTHRGFIHEKTGLLLFFTS